VGNPARQKVSAVEVERRNHPPTIGDVTTHRYMLKRIDKGLWKRATDRALAEGRSIRFVLITCLEVYAEYGFAAFETFNGGRTKKR